MVSYKINSSEFIAMLHSKLGEPPLGSKVVTYGVRLKEIIAFKLG